MATGPIAAHAEEPPSPTSTQSPQAVAPSVTITAPSPGQFVPQNTVTVTGTKTADSSVAVTIDGGAGCSTPASALTTWSCPATLPNGQGVVITATETLADATTSTAMVTVNVLGPPTINPTAPQESPGVASGTGFPGSRIQLAVNGATQACSALVSPSGQWLCTIAGGPNTYTVSARQAQDWGTSDASSAVTLIVNPAPPADPPAPSKPSPALPAPVIPPLTPVVPEVPPEPSPSPTPVPDDRSDGGTLPWFDRPIFPGPGGQGPTIREALTNWGTPTGFGASLPTPAETVASGNWLWAPLLGLAFIGLIAVPARLLASTLRGRIPLRRPQLAGRNRGTAIAEDAPTRNPWLAGLVPLAATAGLIVLAHGIDGEVRYARLLAAVGAGLAILNVAVALATRLAARSQDVSGRLRFLPMLLIVAAIATVLARTTGMEPPLVGGVLIAAGFVYGVPSRSRALVNLAQVGGVLLLAVLAWLAHSVLGPVHGFWASVLSETLAAVCLAGLGSAVILMLPIGTLPGRVVLEWSRPVWAVITLAVATVAAGILLGGSQPAFPMLATILIVSGFAAVCVAVWAWVNYVEVARA